MKHSRRTREGFKGEDAEARSLKRKGRHVKQMPKNLKGHDLKVDGKNVEIKSVTETTYKGSDGYPIRGFVASNMKKNPNADKYIIRCLSKDRNKVLHKYVIPASKVRQNTLTITPNGKYKQYKVAGQMMQPLGFEHHYYPETRKPLLKSILKEKLQSPLTENIKARIIGAGIGLTLGSIHDNSKTITSGVRSERTNFKNVLLALAGSEIASRIQRRYYGRLKKDQKAQQSRPSRSPLPHY